MAILLLADDPRPVSLQIRRALSGGGVWPLAASTRQQLVNTATYRLRQQVQVGV